MEQRHCSLDKAASRGTGCQKQKKLVPKCVVLLERINTPSEEDIVKNQENSGTKSCDVWLKKSAAKKMSS